jgi:hypothetical protein
LEDEVSLKQAVRLAIDWLDHEATNNDQPAQEPEAPQDLLADVAFEITSQEEMQ